MFNWLNEPVNVGSKKIRSFNKKVLLEKNDDVIKCHEHRYKKGVLEAKASIKNISKQGKFLLNKNKIRLQAFT